MPITYNNSYNYKVIIPYFNGNWINYLWKMDRGTEVYDGYYYQIKNNTENSYEIMKNLFMTKKVNQHKDYHGSTFVAEAVSQNPEMKYKLMDFINHHNKNYDMYIALINIFIDENSEANYFTNQEFITLLDTYVQMTEYFLNNQETDLQNLNIKKQVLESITSILDSPDDEDDIYEEVNYNNYCLKELFKKYNLYQRLKRLVNINM